MKSTLYRKSISILKYLGLLVATILLFLGLNFWSNQLDDLHIQDVKIYNTFFAMENGKPTFYLYGKLKPLPVIAAVPSLSTTTATAATTVGTLVKTTSTSMANKPIARLAQKKSCFVSKVILKRG